ncbi:MAG: glycerol kinase GlpK [Spirochaetales bacterium]|nr:glycerol kinase GlpK [Spirochaetales bacterium]
MKCILSIDQGTTGSRVFCFGQDGQILGSAYREFTQHFPRPGWVEHDAKEIWQGVEALIVQALRESNIKESDVLAIGITNQRETTVIWDRKNGQPIHNAIVWQCRRTAARCTELKDAGHAKTVQERTGLVIDAYFSATKMAWILDSVPGARERAARGELAAGTIDSFLLFSLTGEHRTEYTNASRTMLFNIREKRWDDTLLELFQVPATVLPEVLPSAAEFGRTRGLSVLPDGIPVLAMVGDQQAALFGQLCTKPGQAKNTYGTGCFLLFHTGSDFQLSKNGLLTTLAVDGQGQVAYALEGSVFIGGAVVQWLRDYMHFLAQAKESEEIIQGLPENDEIVMVPAFAGLGAPYWDMQARGAIFGLSRDTSPAQIVRAGLKSIALQSLDLVRAMEQDTGKKIQTLRVDGGATANHYLMQYQADILGCTVERPANVDTTAVGSAYLAGLKAGLWDESRLQEIGSGQMQRFTPGRPPEWQEREIRLWHKAVERSGNWSES